MSEDACQAEACHVLPCKRDLLPSGSQQLLCPSCLIAITCLACLLQVYVDPRLVARVNTCRGVQKLVLEGICMLTYLIYTCTHTYIHLSNAYASSCTHTCIYPHMCIYVHTCHTRQTHKNIAYRSMRSHVHLHAHKTYSIHAHICYMRTYKYMHNYSHK